MNFDVKYLVASLLLGSATLCQAAIPSGYYDSLEGKSGVTLKKAVKAAARSHTAISYGDDTWSVFRESDTRMVGNQLCWWDMYSNNNVTVASGHPGMNIEHSVANSWWGGTKNDAYKDLMHLNPSNSEANNRKSNYPLGIVKTQTWSNGVTIVGKPANGSCGGAPYVYEPCDEYKGDFARVFFYMFTIYDDIAWRTQSDRNFMYNKSSELLLQPWAYEMLLEWAKADPVSQKEIDRNNTIYKHQKNRNPFIDYPELAEHIWGSKKNTPFHLDGQTDPGADPDPENPDIPDNPGSDVPAGYWYAVTSTSDLNTSDRYVIVATETKCAMSAKLGSSGKYFEVCGSAPSIDKTSSPSRLTAVPSDAAVITLVKSGAGWILEGSDMQGNRLGFLCSTSAKTLNYAPSASANGTTATLKVTNSSTTISYPSAGELQYNASAPRFLTYTSTQEPVMLYRLQEEKEAGVEATGGAETADEEILGIYDINGRRVATGSLDGLEGGIYIVVSNFGTKKIAIRK